MNKNWYLQGWAANAARKPMSGESGVVTGNKILNFYRNT